jgi:hypothetical protein
MVLPSKFCRVPERMIVVAATIFSLAVMALIGLLPTSKDEERRIDRRTG